MENVILENQKVYNIYAYKNGWCEVDENVTIIVTSVNGNKAEGIASFGDCFAPVHNNNLKKNNWIFDTF